MRSASAMSLFDISARAMTAQMVRLNTVASNLAHAGQPAASADVAYRARRPYFETAFATADRATVDARAVMAAGDPPTAQHQPGHPLADKDGRLWVANINSAAEMVDMLDAAQVYRSNLQVMTTARDLALAALRS